MHCAQLTLQDGRPQSLGVVAFRVRLKLLPGRKFVNTSRGNFWDRDVSNMQKKSTATRFALALRDDAWLDVVDAARDVDAAASAAAIFGDTPSIVRARSTQHPLSPLHFDLSFPPLRAAFSFPSAFPHLWSDILLRQFFSTDAPFRNVFP